MSGILTFRLAEVGQIQTLGQSRKVQRSIAFRSTTAITRLFAIGAILWGIDCATARMGVDSRLAQVIAEVRASVLMAPLTWPRA